MKKYSEIEQAANRLVSIIDLNNNCSAAFNASSSVYNIKKFLDIDNKKRDFQKKKIIEEREKIEELYKRAETIPIPISVFFNLIDLIELQKKTMDLAYSGIGITTTFEKYHKDKEVESNKLKDYLEKNKKS